MSASRILFTYRKFLRAVLPCELTQDLAMPYNYGEAVTLAHPATPVVVLSEKYDLYQGFASAMPPRRGTMDRLQPPPMDAPQPLKRARLPLFEACLKGMR